jgi:Nif-specific regulatory protein
MASAPVHGTRRSDISLVGVYEISKLLTQPARLEATLGGVLQLLSSFLDMRHGLIALLDEHGTPEVVVGSGWSEATAKHYFERLPERAIGRIVVTRMPLVIEHMKSDPLFENWDFSEWGAAEGDSSFIGVPIKDRGSVVGTLTIDREHGEIPYFGLDADVRFLTMIANLIGQTVRVQRLISRDREWLMAEQRRLEKTLEHTVVPERVPAPAANSGGIIGTTPAIRAVLDKVRRVARSHSPVLLRGESGTGKEMFAKTLHEMSPRAKQPFVAVNCAALAESVLESELFGHEKGSFTGATEKQIGKFELAHKGTIFLDEVGELPVSMQVKLLRVIQEREVERVGGTRTLRLDFRVIAATNRDLKDMINAGGFRGDLFYRLNIFPLRTPGLREIVEDIPRLAYHVLSQLRERREHAPQRIAPEAMRLLTAYQWPGNVRELQNILERGAVEAGEGGTILVEHLAPEIRAGQPAEEPALEGLGSLKEELARFERRVIARALGLARGNRTKAAEMLGIHRTGLYQKLHRHGLEPAPGPAEGGTDV